MKTILLIPLLALFSTRTFAAPSDQPVYPGGPFLKRTAPFSQWTVSYQYGKKAASKAVPDAEIAGAVPQSASQDQSPRDLGRFTADPLDYQGSRVLQATFAKTGNVIHEDYLYENGKRGAKWIISGLQVTDIPGKGKSRHYDSAGDVVSVDYHKGDFTGFDWVSARNFAGIQKMGERSILIFQEERDSYEASAPAVFQALLQARSLAPGASAKSDQQLRDEVSASLQSRPVKCVAYIDEQTRFPVALVIGDETRRFRFGTAPSAAIVPPPDIVAEFQAWQQLLNSYRVTRTGP